MAFRTQKISQMTPKGADLEATDLLEVSTIESGSYVTRSITGQEIIDAAVGNVDWGDIGGTLSDQTDLNTALSGKVPTTRTLTINGTTQDLSADRTFTISTGITIGTTAITSGTVGRVLFEGTGNVVQESANLFWDDTNGRLGIGGTPSETLDVKGNATSGFNAISFKSQYTSVGYLGGDNTSIFFSTAPSSGGSYLSLSGSNANLNGVQNIRFLTGSTERARIASTTGNVLINTTTDAGFKLDVNGTARVTGTFSLGGDTARIDLWRSSGAFGGRIGTGYTNPSVNHVYITCDTNSRAIVIDDSNRTVFASSLGTSTVASAQVAITSTTRGFLPPRMTTTQKNAIATPAAGLMVYDTTLNKLCVYTTTWETITSI